MPVVTIHSTGNVTRGKTGSFVLELKPALMFGATFVNFKVGGTAIPGVNYTPVTNLVTFYGASCDELKNGQVTKLDIVYGCPNPPIN